MDDPDREAYLDRILIGGREKRKVVIVDYDPEWPELVHPFASAIDCPLPVPPSKVHLMLRFKPDWVKPDVGDGDACFDLYPEESLEDWHKRNGVWEA